MTEIEKGKTGDSIIDRYLEKANTDGTAMSDISIFSYNLSKFIDNEMKKLKNMLVKLI